MLSWNRASAYERLQHYRELLADPDCGVCSWSPVRLLKDKESASGSEYGGSGHCIPITLRLEKAHGVLEGSKGREKKCVIAVVYEPPVIQYRSDDWLHSPVKHLVTTHRDILSQGDINASFTPEDVAL